jgi:hypothetical protein
MEVLLPVTRKRIKGLFRLGFMVDGGERLNKQAREIKTTDPTVRPGQ